MIEVLMYICCQLGQIEYAQIQGMDGSPDRRHGNAWSRQTRGLE